MTVIHLVLSQVIVILNTWVIVIRYNNDVSQFSDDSIFQSLFLASLDFTDSEFLEGLAVEISSIFYFGFF